MVSVFDDNYAVDNLMLNSPSIETDPLEDVITRFKYIGDYGISLVEECVVLTDMITTAFYQQDYNAEAILMTTRAMIVEQPHKQPNIAFLYIQISKMDPELANKMIMSVIHEFQEQLNLTVKNGNNILQTSIAGPWTTIKLLTRFISLLSPIINNKNLIEHYRNIIQLACEMNRRKFTLANLVLESALINIPYLFYYNRQNKILLFEMLTLINETESTFKENSSNVNLFKPFCLTDEDNSNVLGGNISLKKIKLLLNNGLENFNKVFPSLAGNTCNLRCKTVSAIWSLNYPKLERLTDTQEIDIGHTVTDNIWNESSYLTYETKFYKIKYSSDQRPLTDYDQHLIRDNVIDVVHNLEFNKKEASKKLIQFENYFGNVSKTSDIECTKTDINRRIVTTISSFILRLQYAYIPSVYYSTLLQELCKRNAKIFGPLLGEQFRFIYENLYSLDYEGTLNFEKWFRLQISNFDFRWKWYEWEDDCTYFWDLSYNSKHIFHQNIVKRLLNSTSNISQFKENLPKIFQTLLEKRKYFKDQQLTNNLVSQYNFGQMEIDFNNHGLLYLQSCFQFSPVVADIIEFMRQNNTADVNNSDIETVNILLEQIKTRYFGSFNNFPYFIIELLTQCICHCGSRSISHANNYISAFGDSLLTLSVRYKIEREITQKLVLESVIRYWNHNVSTGFLIINSFKQFDLVDDLIILEFLFHGCNDEIKVITCYDTREFLFKILEDEMKWSPDPNIYLFVDAYRLTLLVTSDALIDLNIEKNGVLNYPESSSYPFEISENDDSRWQYFESMKLIKCLLRKFHSVYRTLADILISVLKQIGISHRNTVHAIVSWIKECQNID